MGKIIRTFHPVGQGAFYSERHLDYNIVYDCGSNSRKKAEGVVSQAFSKDETIDVLFISHFDEDHVNLIEKLKDSVKEIKYVVMPLLDINKEVLARLYGIIYPNYPTNIITNPALFFGTENIINVKSAEENDGIDSVEPISIESISTEILSGTSVRITNDDWILIPYNYRFQERTQELKVALIEENIDYDKLKSDIDYLNQNKDSIKKIFKGKKITGAINENSMVLYSGPCRRVSPHYYLRNHLSQSFCRVCHYCDYLIHEVRHRPACIYTGDADLNKLRIKTVFGQFWESVGTIQVPHHGSKENFDFSILKGSSYICPVSFGINNQFGHPSTKVMSSILADASLPIQITEDMSAAYYQIVEK